MWKCAVRAARRGLPSRPGSGSSGRISSRRRCSGGSESMPRTEERDVVVEIVELLPEGVPRAEEVAADLAVHQQDEGALGLPVGVVGGEVVGEELAILEDRVDRIAEKAGLAAELADAGAVGGGAEGRISNWRGSVMDLKGALITLAITSPVEVKQSEWKTSVQEITHRGRGQTSAETLRVPSASATARPAADVGAGWLGDRGGERRGRIFGGPGVEPAVDDAVHVAAANADDRRAAGLRLQRDQAEGLLHAGVHEEIGRAVVSREPRAGRRSTGSR